ncbi:hypothetical protein PG984_009826 [Apiospora sp. TS-2023a]
MAVMGFIRWVCIRMIRGVMKGLSLVNHAPIRILDEEQMMAHCQAAIDSDGCQGAMVDTQHCKLCVKHAKQERAIYHFRKYLEKCCRNIEGLKSRDRPEDKRVALVLISIVIVARIAQRDWFYPGENCEHHIKHENEQCIHLRGEIKNTLWDMGYAINTITPDSSLREIIKTILTSTPFPQSLDSLRKKSEDSMEEISAAKREVIMAIWEKLEGLEFVALLDHQTATPAQLTNPNCEYIDDIFATDYELVDWNAAFEADSNAGRDRAKLQKNLWTKDFDIITRVPEHDLREVLRNIVANVTITQPLDVLGGVSRGTREGHLLAKQEAAAAIWEGLEGLEIIELLDRRMATPTQLMDENFEYQSEEDIFRPRYDHVDCNKVRDDF